MGKRATFLRTYELTDELGDTMTFLALKLHKNSHFSHLNKLSIGLLILCSLCRAGHGQDSAPANLADPLKFVQIGAKNKFDRSEIAQIGISIEATRSDSVWGFATDQQLSQLSSKGFQILGNFDYKTGRGGHETIFDFPPKDSQFHTYARLTQELHELENKNPDLVKVSSIGKSFEGRDIWAIHMNSNPQSLTSNVSNQPGIVYMGNHHAREHVSVEVPLLFAHYLIDHKNHPEISHLLNSRDIWIVPMVNPDGSEFDVASGTYQWWRKNRRPNADGSFGVDLNRNYSYQWGTGGSEVNPTSETYMGTKPFSEPETQSIRDFMRSHLNLKVLLSFHTFSELILYPWGYTYDGVSNPQDVAIYKTMANAMAQWNHYTPEQASELYIASGDTTDWAYGELGVFSFTFELSPNGTSAAGFYPGEGIIHQVFQSNLQPCLYLLKMAGNPHQVLDSPTQAEWLPHYIQPKP
jgi:carboxypeptidase T